MAYTKIGWTNNVTPLNAENMNHMDDGIADAIDKADSLDVTVESIVDGTTIVDKASKDAKGNVIDETYATKAEMPEQAPVVTLSTDDTITNTTFILTDEQIESLKNEQAIIKISCSADNCIYFFRLEQGYIEFTDKKVYNTFSFLGSETDGIAYQLTLEPTQKKAKIYKTFEFGDRSSIENIIDGITVVAKANADAKGNVIDTTYATKAEIGEDWVDITKSWNGTVNIALTLTNDEIEIIKSKQYVRIVLGTTQLYGYASSNSRYYSFVTQVSTSGKVVYATADVVDKTLTIIAETFTQKSIVDSIVNGTTVVSKASKDAKGNVIDETYATKDELDEQKYYNIIIGNWTSLETYTTTLTDEQISLIFDTSKNVYLTLNAIDAMLLVNLYSCKDYYMTGNHNFVSQVDNKGTYYIGSVNESNKQITVTEYKLADKSYVDGLVGNINTILATMFNDVEVTE